MKAEFLQLETGEDVASVRDRLTFLRGQRVLLIWPENGTALTRKLDLVLVQREAMRLAVRLALITHDAVVIRHAAELNISTFETVGQSERGKWKRGRSKVFTTRFQRPKDEPEAEELKQYASRVLVDDEPRSAKIRRAIGRLVTLLLLVGVLFAVGIIVLPSATITLTPAQERLQIDATIIADPDRAGGFPDVENGIIPAISLIAQIEERGTIETTGAQDLLDTAAAGSVIFINRTNQNITIPAGQVLSTSAGTTIRFRTMADTNLAGGIGLQSEVPVEAEAAGSSGNVDANQINTIVDNEDLAPRVEVRNLAPITGGEDRAVRAVSADDRDRLIAILRQQLQDRAYTEMLTRIDESQFLIPETVRISEERTDWMVFDHEVGDVADALTLTMRVIVAATAVDEQTAQQVAFARLAGQIPAGRSLRPETILYERGAVTSFEANGRVIFNLTCSALAAQQVNYGELSQQLAGRTPEEAMQTLTTQLDLAEGTTPQIVVNPDWLPRLPLLPVRIQLKTQSPGV